MDTSVTRLRDTTEGRQRIADSALKMLHHEDRRTRHDPAQHAKAADELRPFRELAVRYGAVDPFATEPVRA